MSYDTEESAHDVPPSCETCEQPEDDCSCWCCVSCDEQYGENDTMYGNVCEGCFSEYVSTCDTCGDYVQTGWPRAYVDLGSRVVGEAVGTECGNVLCPDCVYYCSECDTAHCSEAEVSECCGDASAVHDYSYRPSLRFWSLQEGEVVESPRATAHALYVGVEIEAERASDTAAQFLADADEEAGDERFVYLKRDGSLGDGGVEIVTHPATPEAFLARFPFDAVEKWTARGARSYRREACGFHIHVARSAFSASHLWRFVRFQLANVEQCIGVAQRESQRWAEWSGEGMDEVKKSLPAMVKGTKANGRRYVAINFQNRNTVELRYFKGNLSPRIIRRQVLFISAMHAYTKDMTMRDVRDGAFDWSRFVAWCEADPMHRTIAEDMRAAAAR